MSIVAVHGPNTFGSQAVKSAGPVTAVVDGADGTIWTFSYNGGTSRALADFVWTYTPAGGSPASPVNGALSTTIDFTTAGDKTVTLTVSNTAKTVSNKALTSNVATLTTSTAHGFVAGTTVVVTAVDSTFNGTYTVISAPTTTTFTYAVVAADVVSAASTGTVTSTGVPTAAAYPITVTSTVGAGPTTGLMMAPPGDEVPEGDEFFDPGDYTVAEVEDFVRANPEQVEDVLAAEEAGKNRVTLVTWLEEFEA